jgi:hypothetical protein
MWDCCAALSQQVCHAAVKICMPGARWTALEYDIVVFYHKHNYRNEDAQSALRLAGKHRTINAI